MIAILFFSDNGDSPHFLLANYHCQRHPFFSSHLQTLLDSLSNILLTLFFSPALTNATRHRWTFSYEHPVLILRYNDKELHFPFLSLIDYCRPIINLQYVRL